MLSCIQLSYTKYLNVEIHISSTAAYHQSFQSLDMKSVSFAGNFKKFPVKMAISELSYIYVFSIQK